MLKVTCASAFVNDSRSIWMCVMCACLRPARSDNPSVNDPSISPFQNTHR
uniref:Uncharacterized protein n=1 Tax=Anguilla anguilla TaxID=7936 RepID=A0A0E9RQ48_ANGAN